MEEGGFVTHWRMIDSMFACAELTEVFGGTVRVNEKESMVSMSAVDRAKSYGAGENGCWMRLTEGKCH